MATDRSVTVGSVDVQPTDIVHNLGVLLDSELTMKQHVNKVTSACFYHLRRLRAETSRVPGHTAAACLSLHLKPAGLLQLTSLRTAVVDHHSPSAHAERHCAARSGLVTTWPRQFCTPDITLAAHLLPDTVQDRTTHVQCTHWPLTGVHQWHRGTCCQ